jgi:hypothetical protein
MVNNKRREGFVAIVAEDSTFDNEDIDKITAYCESCASFGFNYKLGPRIYPNNNNKNELILHDSDNWLQCYNCGEITSKVHAKQINEIAPIVETPKTIHDTNKIVVLSTKGGLSHKRSKAIIDQIKKTRPGYDRSKDYTNVDLDIRNVLNAGKKLVSYNSTNDEFQDK